MKVQEDFIHDGILTTTGMNKNFDLFDKNVILECRDGIHPSMLGLNKNYQDTIQVLFNKTFKIPYWIRDNGDGSASLVIEKTLDIAFEKAEEQRKNGAGFCEACGELDVVVNNDNTICNGTKIDGK